MANVVVVDGETASMPVEVWMAYARRSNGFYNALLTISKMQPEILALIRQHGFVFDDIGTEEGNWQHLAFSLYTEICQIDLIARDALARDVGAEQEDEPSRQSDEGEAEVVQGEVHEPTVPPSPDDEPRATICDECGSGLLDGQHIADYPCSKR